MTGAKRWFLQGFLLEMNDEQRSQRVESLLGVHTYSDYGLYSGTPE
jgi:hypothetical protein